MNSRNQVIGERLWQERTRLVWTQSEAAKRGEVGFSTYCSYEKGESSPKAETLQRWAESGMDVLYIIMGNRQSGVLSDQDNTLLSALSQVDERVRQSLISALMAAVQTYNTV